MPYLGREPYFHPNVSVRNCRFGSFVEIGEGSNVLDSVMGDYSYTARYADIAYSQLGKFVNVAAFTRLNPGEHPYHRASLHHFMYRSSYFWPDEPDEQAVFDWRRSRPVRVGHDTWIGHGAIVGAQAVVTKDVPPYAVVAGAPARHIKWRHPREVADRLQALAWWDWTHEELRTALPDFRALSAEAFLEKYERRTVMQPLHSVV